MPEKKSFRPLAFWREMDPGKKDRILRLCGLAAGIFALVTLLAVISYLFTWKADMSLLGDPDRLDLSREVHNAAGKGGARWGYLLVGRWFGLGSFAIVAALAVISFRLLAGRDVKWLRVLTMSLTGAMVSSLLLALVGHVAGLDHLFGGGLGGSCGSNVIRRLVDLTGMAPTLILVLLAVFLWFYFSSRRFSDWLSGLGKHVEPAPADTDEPAAKPSVVEPAVALAPVYSQVKEEPAKPSKPVVAAEPANPAVETAKPVSQPVAPVVPSAPAGNDPQSPAAPEAPGTTGEGLEIIEGEDLSTDIQQELPRIDVRDELRDYRFPPLTLLDDYSNSRQEVSEEELKRNNFKIRATLKTYKIDVDNVKAVVGPTVTLYKVYPAPGVKIAAIRNLQDDIAMALHAKGVRVTTLEDSVGIEVANDHSSIVPLKAMLNDASFRESKAELPVAIGYTITQKVKVFDLTDAPHLLVAGATKQGKSVGLNVLITSLLYAKHPSELKFVFIDPKMVEFSAYSHLLKHYLAVLPSAASESDEIANSINKTPEQADAILKSLCVEMDERYKLLSMAMVNNVKLYNEKYKDRHLLPTEGHKYLPYIVVVVDEYADLTMTAGSSGDAKARARSISTSIIRLAQKGRAAGIHVVLATQRPSVDVITGLIKANFPTRIAFRVFSNTDSRTILDGPGAEKLIGKGDMIYYAGADSERVQCAFISNDEINTVNEFIGDQIGYRKSYNTPYYLPAPEPDQAEDGTAMIDMKNLDERFEEAARQVVMTQRGSTSDLQRKLGMGYAKAGRVMDQLEAAGIVGPQQGSKPREVLIADLNELEGVIEAFRNNQA